MGFYLTPCNSAGAASKELPFSYRRLAGNVENADLLNRHYVTYVTCGPPRPLTNGRSSQALITQADSLSVSYLFPALAYIDVMINRQNSVE